MPLPITTVLLVAAVTSAAALHSTTAAVALFVAAVGNEGFRAFLSAPSSAVQASVPGIRQRTPIGHQED